MVERWRVVEDNLVVLVVLTGVVGLAFPEVGGALRSSVPALLAVLMLAASLTFDLAALRAVPRRPALQVLATLLVYGPMSLVALVIAWAVFGSGSLWLANWRWSCSSRRRWASRCGRGLPTVSSVSSPSSRPSVRRRTSRCCWPSSVRTRT
jgi:hypothetical protein